MKASIWSGAVEGPGLYLGTPEEIYHGDPCPGPSLSSHLAKIVLNRSLRHAQHAHPRLNPPVLDEDAEEETEKFFRHLEIGAGAHTLTLGAGAEIVEIEAKDYRAKSSQAARKAAHEAGQTPLLTRDLKLVKAMAEIARPVMIDLMGGEFIPEAMMAWQERGLWRRGLIDATRPDLRRAGDYKTSGVPVPPAAAAQRISAYDYAFQERFYGRGFDHFDPEGRGARKFYFLFQEVEDPHEISIVETDEAHRSMADEKVAAACALWDRALVTGEWPGYPRTPYTASPKAWDLTAWEERAATDETLNPMEFA